MGEREPLVGVGQLLIAEYQSIKEEQRARIGFRDNLLYVTLAAVAGVAAASLEAARATMLLALPPVCVVLGWTYLVNDEKISAIGRYVRTELAPRLGELAGPGAGAVFGWETAHRGDARRRSRKAVQCLVDLGAFCAVPLAALVGYWTDAPGRAALLVLSALEALAVLALGVHFVLYALPFTAPAPEPSRAPVCPPTQPPL
ncbi:hypothetical protein VSR01_00625 [Actinacidiphila sp. DG2A-62]|uniref:hypothetical protein n=1 Tax=Actinacidiphila sp. DG2A-62 TaxID=3108821 RepID=UPI002DBC624F|nr:hypothetical protein [Actinacidiphila sp. DG2A-62]MEC3992127.1 hypothetical protein [Actinacidiphila sp. DG2A-62]